MIGNTLVITVECDYCDHQAEVEELLVARRLDIGIFESRFASELGKKGWVVNLETERVACPDCRTEGKGE